MNRTNHSASRSVTSKLDLLPDLESKENERRGRRDKKKKKKKCCCNGGEDKDKREEEEEHFLTFDPYNISSISLSDQ